nr:hypothetical protein [uncultured Desulfobacter sp.]
MKKSSIIVAACLMVCGLFLAQPAFAALSGTVWSATGDQIITFEMDGADFGICNLEDQTYYNLADGYNVISVDGSVLKLNGEEILNTTSFGVYLGTGTGDALSIADISTTYTYDACLGGYVLNFGSSATTLFIGGATPNAGGGSSEAPIPTAMLLMGTGLVGLAGFKRRIDEN